MLIEVRLEFTFELNVQGKTKRIFAFRFVQIQTKNASSLRFIDLHCGYPPEVLDAPAVLEHSSRLRAWQDRAQREIESHDASIFSICEPKLTHLDSRGV
jgi:hypothetical protein